MKSIDEKRKEDVKMKMKKKIIRMRIRKNLKKWNA